MFEKLLMKMLTSTRVGASARKNKKVFNLFSKKKKRGKNHINIILTRKRVSRGTFSVKVSLKTTFNNRYSVFLDSPKIGQVEEIDAGEDRTRFRCRNIK
jgi:hypothetical protein